MTRLTPELVTELFCPTLISCENPNVNGAVEKILEQNVWQKNTKKVYDFVFECMGINIKLQIFNGFFCWVANFHKRLLLTRNFFRNSKNITQ